MKKAKEAVLRLIGGKAVGRLEYYFRPGLKTSYGGPFNGQSFRQRIFKEIVKALPLEAVIETGTCRGTTTEFMAETGLSVFSIENDLRLFTFASLRFRGHPTVHLFFGDSRETLKSFLKNPRIPKNNVFFYLDAHPFNNQDELPLREEVGLVFENWADSVVLIDDFQVPGTDYVFCDYGQGRIFNLEYLKPVLKPLSVFFPSAGPEAESGRKSGCVVLCREAKVYDALSDIPSLAIYKK
jgi:hypothetical protein